MRAIFVVVAVSSILIKIERAVGPLVNPKFDWSRGLLTRVLNFWAKGNDRTGTYIEGNAV